MERKKSERIATTQEERSRFTSRQLVDPGSVVLGIGGGVGPSAGVGLHQKIIDNTRSKTDQGHFTVVHISRSAHIQDRTKFLLGEIEINPGVCVRCVPASPVLLSLSICARTVGWMVV
jgi:hypothetical protein